MTVFPEAEIAARVPAATISTRLLEDGATTFTVVGLDDDDPSLIVIASPTAPDAMVLCAEYTFEGVRRDDVADLVAAILQYNARLTITRGLWRFTQLSVPTAHDTYVAGRRYKHDLEPWEQRLLVT
ncbi:hypothetical protein ACFPIJ_04995 [Dactylosporangium cerinum]|uniref:DUF3168 domain-containing protein n=1 Tax=Dactylosporangium cerinum TaxID=1434730 RepID=A0ABV9VLJ7_9ACTN